MPSFDSVDIVCHRLSRIWACTAHYKIQHCACIHWEPLFLWDHSLITKNIEYQQTCAIAFSHSLSPWQVHYHQDSLEILIRDSYGTPIWTDRYSWLQREPELQLILSWTMWTKLWCCWNQSRLVCLWYSWLLWWDSSCEMSITDGRIVDVHGQGKVSLWWFVPCWGSDFQDGCKEFSLALRGVVCLSCN